MELTKRRKNSWFFLRFFFLLICASSVFTSNDSTNHLQLLQEFIYENAHPGYRPGDKDNGVNVTVGLWINFVEYVNEDSGQASLSINVQRQWRDPRLGWNPEDFGGIECVFLTRGLVWEPNLAFGSNVIHTESTREDNGFIVHLCSDAMLEQWFMMKVQVSVQIKVENFPFDTQTLWINYASLMAGSQEIELDLAVDTLHDLLSGVEYNQGLRHVEWDLTGSHCSKYYDYYDFSRAYAHFPYIRCSATVRRFSGFYILNFCIPLTIVTFVGILGMHCLTPMTGQRNSKIQLGLMNLMSMSVISLSLSGNMPRSNSVSRMHRYYFSATALIVSSILVASITMLIINGQGKESYSLVAKIRVISFVVHLFLLCFLQVWFYCLL